MGHTLNPLRQYAKDILPDDGVGPKTIKYPNGLILTIETPYDDINEPPWERGDGHGPVSQWRSIESKDPGECVLMTDGPDRALFYDFAEATRIAKQDGWGAKGGKREGETEKAYRARAVEEDFQYLRAFCHDEWAYIGLIVTLLHEDGTCLDQDAVWGYETDSRESLEYVNAEARSWAAYMLRKYRRYRTTPCKCCGQKLPPAQVMVNA